MKDLSMGQLKAIANQCSQYEPNGVQLTSAVGNNNPNCANCNHYQNSKCNLDLIDEILNNLDQG
ncbi:hypothetical protein [Tepidibacter formicigenes]|jgi:hypothetical protein|uniref:Uncharacterized protein n=1 Tax=Tepidibacter formicigenes DSM 15518 TaxID=1123349 RepID=A0A1M6RXC3_9FIRM|nr:hypothetical protein [Tepidibacter formicigenes]SHK37136.1 hypothetical protein SAMN02744037_02204 [Tepidibacter formicigenes DSM 15518]